MNIEFEIQEIKRRLDRIESKDKTIDNGDANFNKPYQPYPKFIPPAYAANLCPKCGITLEKIMMYSCPQLGCPTGLGGLSCKPE